MRKRDTFDGVGEGLAIAFVVALALLGLVTLLNH